MMMRAGADPVPALDGAAVYAAQCASCHGTDLNGGQFGPALRGPAFAAKWLKGDAAKLSAFIETSMPPANAGQLSHEQYSSVERYIGAATGDPAVEGPAPAAADKSDSNAEGIMDNLRSSHLGVEPAAREVFHDRIFADIDRSRQATLAKLVPVDDATLAAPPASDWLGWRGGHSVQSYSKLASIKAGNVGRLSLAWSWSLPAGPNEIEPLVRDGVLFVESGNEVQALNAATGDLLWKYSRKVPAQYQGSISSVHRNLALYGENLYLATNDRHVVALNAKTGAPVWDQAIIPDSQPAVVLTAGPIVAHGRVIQSVSGGPGCKAGCDIVALDAASGKEAWRFNAIPHAGQPGDQSWNGLAVADRTGAGMWVAGSYSPESDLVYYGVGQTYKIAPLLGKKLGSKLSQDALYTNSTLALSPGTGRLAWFHQHLRRDVWDLDEVFERMLVTLPGRGGAERRTLVEVGKSGILDALDPADGRYLFSIDLGLQNHVRAIDPKTGERSVRPELLPRKGVPQFICPSIEGARNWMTTAYDPATHVLYLPLEETCMQFTWWPNDNPLAFDMGWSLRPRPDGDGNYGRIQAIDLTTRKTLWTTRSRTPPASSLLATAGGVVFSGNRDRSFRALDANTGASLWQVMLNATPSASPITYAVDGKQYVAVATGGGGPHDTESIEITPEIPTGTSATTLWVFQLPADGAAAAR